MNGFILFGEEFGQDIIKHVKKTGVWPDGNTPDDLAKANEVAKI